MPKRTDKNQTEVVAQLRRLGCTVQSLGDVGKGCPDLIIGIHGFNFLIELKSTRKKWLTDKEKAWQNDWSGQVDVCSTVIEILDVFEEKFFEQTKYEELIAQLHEMRKKYGSNDTGS